LWIGIIVLFHVLPDRVVAVGDDAITDDQEVGFDANVQVCDVSKTHTHRYYCWLLKVVANYYRV
jgi:hypothetical protein